MNEKNKKLFTIIWVISLIVLLILVFFIKKNYDKQVAIEKENCYDLLTMNIPVSEDDKCYKYLKNFDTSNSWKTVE